MCVIVYTLLMLLMLESLQSIAGEPRDRQWLINYATQPIADTPRNRRYLEKIDQAELLGILDLEWLRDGQDSLKGRLYATRIGQMAFAYCTPGTRWHQNDELLEQIRAGFRGFADHQTAEGRFVWPEQGRWEYQAHEHVWRLEPLLLAYIWVEQDLTADERERWSAMLRRAGEYLLAQPLLQANNRGAVWCVGSALCGLYFEDNRYLELVRQHAPKLLDGILAETGEVIETQGGGGPDSNYSYVGFAYVYQYRLLMGAEELDAPLLRSMRWLVRYTDPRGNVLAPGASTRKAYGHGDSEVLLPALERYSAEDPYLAHIADQYLEHAGSAGYGVGGLTVNSLIWGLLQQRGGEATAQMPDWFRNYTNIYHWPDTHYLLAGRENYQTAITFDSQFALKGLQTFVWRGERPLVQATGPGLGAQSIVAVEGLNLSRLDVARGPSGPEVWLQAGSPLPQWKGVAPVTVIVRQQSIWTCYAFTPRSLLVVYGGTDRPIRTAWILGDAEGAHLDEPSRFVRLRGGQAGIHFLRGAPALKGSDELRYLEVLADNGPSAFGFSDASFRFDQYDAEEHVLRFSDATGQYQLDLASMLDDQGNINRRSGLRLQWIEGREQEP